MFVVERGLSYRGLPQEGNCRRVVFAQSGFCPTEVSALNRCLCAGGVCLRMMFVRLSWRGVCL